MGVRGGKCAAGSGPLPGLLSDLRSRLRGLRKALLSAVAAVALVAAPVAGGGMSQAAGSLPCDIYAAAATPCVAAHSTVRALYAAYNGPLYQVKRASDAATTNISTLTAGGETATSWADAVSRVRSLRWS